MRLHLHLISRFWWRARAGAATNCHDNAVAEDFFDLLEQARIQRRISAGRNAARQDVFDYIEMFHNPARHHRHTDGLSPVECEWRRTNRLERV